MVCIRTQTQGSARSYSRARGPSLPHGQRLEMCPLPTVVLLWTDVASGCCAGLAGSKPTPV